MKCFACFTTAFLAYTLLVTNAAIPQARGPTAREIDDNAKRAAMSPASSGHTGPDKLEAWLERLKGSFGIKARSGKNTTCFQLAPGLGNTSMTCATVDPTTITYESDVECQGIGSGAGLRCVFQPPRLSTSSLRSAREYDATAVLNDPSLKLPVERVAPATPIRVLYGVDPVAGKISIMLVFNDGFALGATGILEGDAVNFKGQCGNLAADLIISKTAEFIRSRNSRCNFTLRIEAPPGGHEVRYTLNSNFRVLDGLSTGSASNNSFVLHRLKPQEDGKSGGAAEVGN